MGKKNIRTSHFRNTVDLPASTPEVQTGPPPGANLDAPKYSDQAMEIQKIQADLLAEKQRLDAEARIDNDVGARSAAAVSGTGDTQPTEESKQAEIDRREGISNIDPSDTKKIDIPPFVRIDPQEGGEVKRYALMGPGADSVSDIRYIEATAVGIERISVMNPSAKIKEVPARMNLAEEWNWMKGRTYGTGGITTGQTGFTGKETEASWVSAPNAPKNVAYGIPDGNPISGDWSKNLIPTPVVDPLTGIDPNTGMFDKIHNPDGTKTVKQNKEAPNFGEYRGTFYDEQDPTKMKFIDLRLKEQREEKVFNALKKEFMAELRSPDMKASGVKDLYAKYQLKAADFGIGKKFDEMAKKWGNIEKASAKPPSGFNVFQTGGKGPGKLTEGSYSGISGEIKTIDWKDLKKIYKI